MIFLSLFSSFSSASFVSGKTSSEVLYLSIVISVPSNLNLLRPPTIESPKPKVLSGYGVSGSFELK